MRGLQGSNLERAYREVMASRQPLRLESAVVTAGQWLDLSVYPTESGLAIYGRDVSALRRAEANARFLADASRSLAHSLDYDQTRSRAAELAVPHLADWCLVELLEPDGTLGEVAIRSASPEQRLIEEELRRYSTDPARLERISLMRRPELVPAVTAEWVRGYARDARHAALLQTAGLKSVMAIPLTVRDQLLGLVTLMTAESGRVYSEADLPHAEAFGVHIGLAVSNARLYREAQLELYERTQAEEALRDSERRFRTLVTATGALVWRVAPDGRALEEPAGWEQVTGQPFVELQQDALEWLTPVHPADIESLKQAWGEAQQGKRMLEVEFRLRTAHGSYRRMYTMGLPLLDEEGAILEWIGTTVDVHDRREAEEQLHRAQQMETVGRLAGGVAHETNNQMMVILSFVDFLLRSANLTEDQRRDLQHLADAAERVSTLTQQLLALSRRQVLDTRVLELDAVVSEAETVLRRLLGPEIRLSVQYESGPKWVIADRTQLIQILVNLALNARDAIVGSGELNISTRRSDAGPAGGRLGAAWQAPGVALLSVADTGSGIDAPTLSRIFEPFYSTKPTGQASGLGLSVVEGIVSQSGGDIWVESKTGYGTVVTIGLPLTQPAEQPEATAASRMNGGTETILVVDDEEQVRRLLVRGLQLGAYQVVEASGGAEAIAILEQEGGNIRLVVTDIAMPAMSGVELGKRVQGLWPGLPVIYVSGHPYEVIAQDQAVIAPRRFLQKPFKVDTLLSVVRNALDEVASMATQPA
jgi:PAS domain S-box-containing protein